MATQNFTNGVTLSDGPGWAADVDCAAYPALTGVAGTNTITATGPANYSLIASRPPLILTPAVTNTGATTLAITPSGGAALTAKSVFSGGAACVGGELVAGVPVLITYDGTQYNIIGVTNTVGTFTGTLTGVSGSVTQTFYYSKVGRQVVLRAAAALVGTSNAGTKTVTGMPAVIRPATVEANIPILTSDNGGTQVMSYASIATNGTMTCFVTAGAVSNAWTGSGTASINFISCAYTID